MDPRAEIVSFLRQNVEVRNSLQTGDSRPKVRRNLQHFFGKRFSSTRTEHLYQLLLTYAGSAEVRCPGAGILVLKNIAGSQTTRENDLPRDKKALREYLVSSLNTDRSNADLVIEALSIASLDSKIAIKKSNSNHTYLELSEGCIFTAKRLLPESKGYENARVLCIDGFIESVSEIHHLLEHFSKVQESCAVFARGMTDDVLHTIKVNVDRGTLRVCPVLVPYDLDSVNTLADIATVAGGDVVSSYKGELISSIDPSLLTRVEHMVVKPDYVVIKNRSTKARVDQHRARLVRDIDEKPEVEEGLKKRIRALTSSYVEIAIPDDVNFLSNSQQIDEAIRYVSTILREKQDRNLVAEHFSSTFNSTADNIVMST